MKSIDECTCPILMRMAILVLSTALGFVLPSCDGSAEPEVEPDPLVTATIVDALAMSEHPEVTLSRYQREVARLHERVSEVTTADEIVHASMLAAMEGPESIETLGALSRQLAGSVWSTRFTTSVPEELAIFGGGDEPELCPTSDAPIVVYYVNGIGNSIFEALGALEALTQAVRSHAPQLDAEFRLFYNPSGWGTDDDACNSAALGLSRAGVPSQERARWLQLAEQHCAESSGFEDFFAAAVGQWLRQSSIWAGDELLVRRFRDVVTQDVISGKAIVIAAHSQGNYYTRDMLRSLEEVAQMDAWGDPGRPLGIVATGTPVGYSDLTSNMVGSWRTFQVRQDLISWLPGAPAATHENAFSNAVDRTLRDVRIPLVRFVRGALQGPVAVLVALFVEFYPVMRASQEAHAFVASYLAATTPLGNTDTIEATVAETVASVAAELVNELPAAGQGYFQITLTWDRPGDIDLHVIEPDETRVFWGAQTGYVGTLDRDDLTGTGPENFFVCSPERLVSGSYRIQVNNYGGENGTRAEVRVRAGSRLASFEVVLGAANRGVNLIDVATVEYDNGRFEIIGAGVAESRPARTGRRNASSRDALELSQW